MLNITKLKEIDKMTAKRKVTKRTWTTKSGVKKTKEYVYGESLLLFKKTKSGYKLIEENWQEFEKSINEKFGATEATSIINNARRHRNDILNQKKLNELNLKNQKVNYYAGGKKWQSPMEQPDIERGGKILKSKKQRGWNRIDVSSFVSRLSDDVVDRFFINLGITADEVIDEMLNTYGVVIDKADLYNYDNWIHGDDTVALRGIKIDDDGNQSYVNVEIKFYWTYDGINCFDVEIK